MSGGETFASSDQKLLSCQKFAVNFIRKYAEQAKLLLSDSFFNGFLIV